MAMALVIQRIVSMTGRERSSVLVLEDNEKTAAR